jgi:hypothetical protein
MRAKSSKKYWGGGKIARVQALVKKKMAKFFPKKFPICNSAQRSTAKNKSAKQRRSYGDFPSIHELVLCGPGRGCDRHRRMVP